jgi:hypothetical protein
MGNMFNSKSMTVSLSVLLLIVVVFVLVRSCGEERIVRASVSDTEIELGRPIQYADSTAGAKSWLWEFGNGDYSIESGGSYTFPEQGRYQVRLRVDNEQEKLFMIRVRPFDGQGRQDHVIQIDAPDSAIQGEYISFSAVGNDREWKWEFGESGIIDSRERTAIYAYRNHGIYQVRLTSENTQYPAYHIIEILPKYMETDSLDAMTLSARDIQQRLQNIADGKPFNVNYNYILKTYLCDNPNVLVTVNTSKRNDFYSYCQGLRIAGAKNTVVDMVYVEANNPANSCIDHIIVLQYDKSSPRPSSVSEPPNPRANER